MPLGLLGWWLLAINVATYAAYAWDKAAARRPGARRTRERTLWLLNLLGGVVGAWIGMLGAAPQDAAPVVLDRPGRLLRAVGRDRPRAARGRRAADRVR